MSRSSPVPDRSSASPPERIARVAQALADPRRVRALRLLSSGPATVSEIASALGMRPASTSLQLSRLRPLGLVRVLRRGRHRIYSADPDLLSHLLDAMAAVAVERGPGGGPPTRGVPRRPPAGSDLELARTCYDHLAGRAGVELATRMERTGWLVRGTNDFLLTEKGERQLVRRGVDVDACRESRRKLAAGCLDWTERQPHVGGALGAAIFRALERSGYVERRSGRVVHLRRPVEAWVTHAAR
jgi:DNA-binding transcriptional ArsR family regulator